MPGSTSTPSFSATFFIQSSTRPTMMGQTGPMSATGLPSFSRRPSSPLSAVGAGTGLPVAPTAPWEVESGNSAIEAESFRRHVGVVWVICCSGLLYAVAAEVMTRERYQGREAGATALLPPLRTEMNFYWGDRAGAPC